MEMEDRNKKRMEELRKLIDERKSDIDDEIVPGAYYYDVDRVNQLQKELDEFSKEYEELSEIPTLARVEADIRDLNTKLDEVNEELKEANGSYFLTDDMQELENQRKEILEQLADREETKAMIEEVTRLEAEVKALKEDEKDYIGAYFIPEELTNEIKEKEARIAELEEKIKGKKVTTKEVEVPKEKKEEKANDEKESNEKESNEKENDENIKNSPSVEHVKPAERTENGENVKNPPSVEPYKEYEQRNLNPEEMTDEQLRKEMGELAGIGTSRLKDLKGEDRDAYGRYWNLRREFEKRELAQRREKGTGKDSVKRAERTENGENVKYPPSIKYVKPAERAENGKNVKYPPEIRGTRDGKWEVGPYIPKEEPGEEPEEKPEEEIDTTLEWVKPHVKEINEKEYRELRDKAFEDMTDKYYGNSVKEKEYKEALARYKSHIVEKEFTYQLNKDTKKAGTYRTVEDYEGKEADEKFLQLEEYSRRLERMSKSEAGCNDEYELTAIRDYKQKREQLQKEINEVSASDVMKIRRLKENIAEFEENKADYIKSKILELQGEDKHYIETNNDAYNQVVATATNLPTLGKFGQKVPPMERVHGEGVKGFIKNIGITVSNGFIHIRNVTTAPIYRGIGKHIVSPIHNKVFKPDERTAGLYKNKQTHRYQARKNYFAEKYSNELEEINKQRMEEGKNQKRASALKLIFGVRVDAIAKYKEGNKAVLSKSAHDIEKSVKDSLMSRNQQEAELEAIERTQEINNKKIESVNEKIKNAKDEKQKEKLEKALEKLQENRREINAYKTEINSKITKGIVQTDAVSLSQHDVANASNMTKMVTGIQTVLAAGGKQLTSGTRIVYTPVKKKVWVPGKTTVDYMDPNKVTMAEAMNKLNNIGCDEATQNIFPTYPANFKPGTVHGIALTDGKKLLASGAANPMAGGIKYAEVKLDPNVLNNPNSIVADVVRKLAKDPQSLQVVEKAINDHKTFWGKLKAAVSPGKVPPELQGLTWKATNENLFKTTIQNPGHWFTKTFWKKTEEPTSDIIYDLFALGIISDEIYENTRRDRDKTEQDREGTLGREVKENEKDNKAKLRGGKKANYTNDYGFKGTKRHDQNKYEDYGVER